MLKTHTLSAQLSTTTSSLSDVFLIYNNSAVTTDLSGEEWCSNCEAHSIGEVAKTLHKRLLDHPSVKTKNRHSMDGDVTQDA